MKSYTDLEQSKKLAEILPLESADMTYCAITEGVREKMIIKDWQVNIGLDVAIIENLFSYRNGCMVPCWSLTALLNVFPKDEYKDVDLCFGGYQGDNYIDEWFCSYEQHNHPFFIETCHAPTPVDACVEMIIKLKENNNL